MRTFNMTFVRDLLNSMSKIFVRTAMKIERELLQVMRVNNSDVVAIRVHQFKNDTDMFNGNVIIKFIIILNNNATLNNRTAHRLSQSLRNAIYRRNFTMLSVDSRFNVTVRG